VKLVIDLQGAQSTGSRSRGIGRYSLALAREMARQAGGHEVWVALNGLFPDTIEPLRDALDGLIPQDRIVVWSAPGPVAALDPANTWRRQAGEWLREAFLAALKPDILHVSSLFEGLSDDALSSVGTFEDIESAVTLYDLIPLINSAHYLENPVLATWYQRKIGHARRAGLWLAISESSRREGIEWLNLPEDRVISIPPAADSIFRVIDLSPDDLGALRQRYGLTKPFVMYTGGIDHRKNIDRLIQAYAALPPPLRAGHQLAIVCAANPGEREILRWTARTAGLAAEDLVLTGFIPDADMIALYNTCAAFVFPSWHEGFGLPALEAMNCGAPVIGANTSSLPEVIGRPDALFDPFDIGAITARLHAVLTDEPFRLDLKRHGLEQARQFSWANSARRAWDGFERLHARNREQAARHAPSPVRRRPRLAYVSPLPPLRSGIADYGAELLPELARHYDIEVITHQAEVTDPWIAANCPVRGVQWFDEHARRYDRILYQIGNSEFHWHMFDLLARHPGAVVLHDFFLSGVTAYMTAIGTAPGAWVAALYGSHGYPAVEASLTAADQTPTIFQYPANLSVLRQADGIIVHSEFSRQLAAHWYGAGFADDWAVIAQMRVLPPPPDRAQARAALGLDEADFLVCSFGMVASTKASHRLLAAWYASALARDPRCRLVFVGDSGGEYNEEMIAAIQAGGGHVSITGFVEPALYRRYLAAADLAVQLRTLSRGETSRAVLDCMAYGLATIVNANGSMAELPDDCVIRLDDLFSDEALGAALTRLWRDPAARRALGERARAHVGAHHHPRRVADQYRDAIERFAETGPQALPRRLVTAISDLPQGPEEPRDWLDMAQAIARNHPMPRARPAFMVDVSALVDGEAAPETARLLRRLLTALLGDPPDSHRIEPVRYDPDLEAYRYARQFALNLRGLAAPELADDLIEACTEDVFLGLEPEPSQAAAQASLKQRGIRVVFLMTDLLGPDESATPPRLSLGWLRPGVDPAGIDDPEPADFSDLRPVLSARPTILMFGDPMPAGGTEQALAAFTLLWSRAADANLLVAGPLAAAHIELIEWLRHHPQVGPRLIWLKDITEKGLSRLYSAASGVLVPAHGGGLALVEAAEYGRPILVRDLPTHREIAGDHARYFSGAGATDLAAALEAWLAELTAGTAPKPALIARPAWRESAKALVAAALGGTAL
jgi:glycosyltransferase involved in cell wall biosynthesis